MDFLYLLVFLLFSHLAFKKKDALFVFRSLGLFLSISIVYYYIYRLWETIPSVINPNKSYTAAPEIIDFILLFLFLSGIIIFVRFVQEKNLSFLIPQRSDFKVKELAVLLVLLSIPWLISLVHFNYTFQTPNYVSIDAPLHFSKFRKTLEHAYDSNDVSGATLSAYVLTHLFLPNPSSTDRALLDFQLANTLMFSLISMYFLTLSFQKFKIRPLFFAGLAYLLIVFGYFFNLMIMGFVSQMFGLFLLLFFLDLFPQHSKRWSGIILLILIAEAQLQTYSYYWLAVTAIFLILAGIKKIIFWPKGKLLLAAAAPLILVVAGFIYFKTSLLSGVLAMANSSGEMYKVVAGNFLIFSPLIIIGISLAIANWHNDKSEFSTMFFAALIFSLLSAAAFWGGFFSSYTFTKSFYLTGPFLFFYSVYALAWLWKKAENPPVARGIILLAVASILVLIAFPIIKKDADPNDTFLKLVSSEVDENIWNPRQRPLDVFRFNSLVFRNKSNRIENFISFDRDKLEFLRGLKPHLPDRYQSYYAYYDPISIEKEHRITMVADFKTSYWVFSLTKIWNRANDNMAEHNEKIVNYDGWLGHYQEPYIIILDTQATNRWLWLNGEKFKWEDFTIEYQVGKNYLLKLKQEHFPPPV